MNFHETIPMWKMPDEEKFDHQHYVCLRLQFERTNKVGCILADLSEYYDWASNNGIEMEHNLLVVGDIKYKSRIMFVFGNAIDALAFKLRWL